MNTTPQCATSFWKTFPRPYGHEPLLQHGKKEPADGEEVAALHPRPGGELDAGQPLVDLLHPSDVDWRVELGVVEHLLPRVQRTAKSEIYEFHLILVIHLHKPEFLLSLLYDGVVL